MRVLFNHALFLISAIFPSLALCIIIFLYSLIPLHLSDTGSSLTFKILTSPFFSLHFPLTPFPPTLLIYATFPHCALQEEVVCLTCFLVQRKKETRIGSAESSILWLISRWINFTNNPNIGFTSLDKTMLDYLNFFILLFCHSVKWIE